MGTLERREVLTHRLGVDGRLTIKTVTGTLRVRGIDGEDAEVTIEYRIRASDQASAERALDSGRVLVDRGSGSLEIETPERRLATGLAWLLGGARVNADVAVGVPWGASVRLETMSGSIEADALVGEQRYRTISGDIRMWRLAGSVDAGSVSGSIFLDTESSLRLRANTISGGVMARATSYHGLMLNTTSGGISVSGALDAAGDHRIETIAGSVDVAPLGGLTAELRTVSGSIHGPLAHRLEGTRGNWRAVVGDGRPSLRVSSTSGSLRLLDPQESGAASRAQAGQSGKGSRVVVGSTLDGTRAPMQPVPPAPSSPPAPALASADEQVVAATSWNEETAEESAVHDAADVAEDEELAVLRALERGEIGVDEAAARLDESGR